VYCLCFILANLVDQKIKGETLFRTIIILPFAVSGIVTGVAWRWLLQPTTGINLFLTPLAAKFGIENFAPTWNSHPDYGMLAITIPAAWQFTGYIMALYLAALRGIPGELKEAAAIDGAGTVALYRHIIIPLLMLSPLQPLFDWHELDSCLRPGLGDSGSGAAFATDMLSFLFPINL
jgi:glucose/mannose transport system permease protein